MIETTTVADAGATTNSPSSQNLSRRAAKKEKRKQQKAEKKRLALEAYLQDAPTPPYDGNLVQNDVGTSPASSVGGKAARARMARQNDRGLVATFHSTSDGQEGDMEWEQHRPQGGAPILSQILPQHLQIVEYLESKEQEMRINGRGQRMKERMVVKVDCHGSIESCKSCDQRHGHEVCDLSNSRARGSLCFASWSSLDASLEAFSLSAIIHLDLSRNELWDISADALKPLSSTCETLDISRNWFESLPESIGILQELKDLHASIC